LTGNYVGDLFFRSFLYFFGWEWLGKEMKIIFTGNQNISNGV